MHINSALLLYGYASFSLSILEYCSEENLIQREQYYIDILQPGYNICKTAGSTLGKLHSDDAKERISNAKKGTNEGENNSFYSKTHSVESRKKMSDIKRGTTLSEAVKAKVSASMLGKKFTEEHKANLSSAQPNCKKLSVLDLETGIETIYNSISDAERKMELPASSIRANLRSKSKNAYRGRYVFKIEN